jgi:hypothetical protein
VVPSSQVVPSGLAKETVMGWLYDGKPNKLIKVFFKSARHLVDLSDFGGIHPVVTAATSGFTSHNDVDA